MQFYIYYSNSTSPKMRFIILKHVVLGRLCVGAVPPHRGRFTPKLILVHDGIDCLLDVGVIAP